MAFSAIIENEDGKREEFFSDRGPFGAILEMKENVSLKGEFFLVHIAIGGQIIASIQEKIPAGNLQQALSEMHEAYSEALG